VPLLRIPAARPAGIDPYLVVRGGRNAQVASILSRIDPATQAIGGIYTVEEHRPKGFVVAQLFAEGRGRFTLLTWVSSS